MARAAQQREVAQRQAEAARQAAGLSQTTSSLNVALNAMNENAAKDHAAAAKAKLLAPTHPERDDPNIAAATAAASGQGPAPIGAANRLAALKAKLG